MGTLTGGSADAALTGQAVQGAELARSGPEGPGVPDRLGAGTAAAEAAAGSPSTVIRRIGQLVTNDPANGPSPLGVISDAALVLVGDQVAWVGPDAQAPPADLVVDAQGRAVLPGWVDSHTHLVYAGDRCAEFTARMAGRPYEAGGIMNTAAATRAASDDELAALLTARLGEMVAGGTTCVETKTGYGLTVPDETRAARLARRLGVDAVTYLGAQIVPPEFATEPDSYVDLVCGPMLDAVTEYADFIDVFCEQGAFDEAQARRILAGGARKGLGGKVHGNQLGPGAGVRMAVDTQAVSVDHCTYLDPRDIDALAGSATVATLLPACDLSTRSPAAPARALLDAGARVALASDANPGTSNTSSMNLVVALGVLLCEMSAEEAVFAATAGGAMALNRTDVGHLSPGARADVHMIDAPRLDYLAYRVGMPLTAAVWYRGERVR